MNTEVLLLETPFFSQTGTDETKAYVQSKYNLALLALGSYLKKHTSRGVRILNMVKDDMTVDELMADLQANTPKVIGIPLYSYNLSSAYQIIRAIRARYPNIHISVGGPHAAIFPKETLALPEIDSMVLGDGEYPFAGICDQVITTGELNPDKLPLGVHVKRNLKVDKPLASYVHSNLDDLPTPDIQLLRDYKEYKDFLSNKVMGILTTSRGCPFVCHFCWSEKSKYRHFSIDKIINIMRYYKDMRVQYIEFWDETFNPTRKRLDDFADAIYQANLGLTWSIRGAVVHHVYPETIRKLRQSGLRIMQFGVESTNDRVLESLNKKMNRGKIENAIKVCRQEGVRSVANMIIGNPGQSRSEITDDFKTLKRYKPTYVSISIYNWAPGTTHYERALSSGTLKEDFWRNHAISPMKEDPVVHPDGEVPTADLYKMRSRYILGYYFNPVYLFNYLRTVSFSEIARAVSIAMMVLKSSIKLGILRFKPTFQ